MNLRQETKSVKGNNREVDLASPNGNLIEVGIGKYSWPQVVNWLLIVLVLYAMGSVLIANPFSIFTDRTTPVDYSRIMYFHGLSVGLAGLTCLIVSQVFNLDPKFKKIIFYCTIGTIFFGVTGGAINRSMEFTKLTLWYQVFSFFALDAIIVTMLIGIIKTKDNALKNSTYYYLVLASSCSALIAALIGDLAGFILDFGDWPGIMGWYAGEIGYTLDEWQSNLLRSHSDMMVVSVIGLILSVINWKYGRNVLGNVKKLKNVSEWFVITGLILMVLILVISGFGSAEFQIPHIFTEKGFFKPRGQSVAGIDLVDFIIGTFFLIGGLLLIASILFGNNKSSNLLDKTSKYTLGGVFLTWLCIVITVAGMGFLQEYRADLYNSANDVPLGDFGFAFRMLHLDVSLMLFPAIMVVMLLAQQFLKEKDNKIIQRVLRFGVITCTIGSLIYMVFNPQPFGPGYWVVGFGFITIITAMMYYFIRSNSIVKIKQK
ncbi:hypothetical protein [Vibrio diazotrophicus]|uniref:hypothetical protein n=1 Tax=Vibrio diazotrophicus TaxID=685 RepID=UPI003D2F629F